MRAWRKSCKTLDASPRERLHHAKSCGRPADELEQATEDLAPGCRRADILIGRTRPRDTATRAELQLAQKNAQRENVRARCVRDRGPREAARRADRELQRLRAPAWSAVVYEDYLAASPRRKIRAGRPRDGQARDWSRFPEVDRMLVEASVERGERCTGLQAGLKASCLPRGVSRSSNRRSRHARRHTGSRVGRSRQPTTKRFDLILDLDKSSPDLRPEMTARVDVAAASGRDVLLIPVNAVFENARRQRQSRRRPRWDGNAGRSSSGNPDGTMVEVIAGLDGRRSRGTGRQRGFVGSCHATPPATVGGSRGRTCEVQGHRILTASISVDPDERLAERRRRPWVRGAIMRRLAAIPGNCCACSVEALGRYKLRTSLSVLGIVLGVAAVIAMMSVSDGARRDALEQFAEMGLDNLVARGKGGGATLTAGDADRPAGARSLSLAPVSPLVERLSPVSRSGKRMTTSVIGVSAALSDDPPPRRAARTFHHAA